MKKKVNPIQTLSGTKIKSNYTGKVYEVQETGIMYPNEQETNTL